LKFSLSIEAEWEKSRNFCLPWKSQNLLRATKKKFLNLSEKNIFAENFFSILSNVSEAQSSKAHLLR
jgi:hypothetical protein